ncbi:uncharacterized protein LOC133915787 [Phragmites australis]|uniref:uncharacterized protein LOC133915787 n=1 Tax=Phragmites australis TaxID=29695 RepID=UPI002D78ABD2|nr:uncharacterized protein LOC133915787 [Phragmites australis]XP_062215074.1 uncharacterized protein LOC133915787 [Phragmites australis]XP_062215075.1 uncharacterized protein LOC133915787 [Phragmites australis]XP_062215076.1 uncharacterized protein LOC133915787 [Phragmites australis]
MAASGSARDEVLAKEVELECGDISASQEDLLARSSFLGSGGEELEVFSTPLTQGGQEQSQQQKHQGGQGGEEEEDAITMCTLPFTQSPSPSPSSSEEGLTESKMMTKQPWKPRVCTRKVRGARIRTPSPSPDRHNSNIVDPLYRVMLMIPTSPAAAAAPTGDLVVLARQRGIFF